VQNSVGKSLCTFVSTYGELLEMMLPLFQIESLKRLVFIASNQTVHCEHVCTTSVNPLVPEFSFKF
jgi:hypothetical protein